MASEARLEQMSQENARSSPLHDGSKRTSPLEQWSGSVFRLASRGRVSPAVQTALEPQSTLQLDASQAASSHGCDVAQANAAAEPQAIVWYSIQVVLVFELSGLRILLIVSMPSMSPHSSLAKNPNWRSAGLATIANGLQDSRAAPQPLDVPSASANATTLAATAPSASDLARSSRFGYWRQPREKKQLKTYAMETMDCPRGGAWAWLLPPANTIRMHSVAVRALP